MFQRYGRGKKTLKGQTSENYSTGTQNWWQHQINQFQLFCRHWGHFWSFRAFFGHFWPLLAYFCPKLKIVLDWSCDHSKRLQDEQKSDGDGFRYHFSDILFGGVWCTKFSLTKKSLQMATYVSSDYRQHDHHRRGPGQHEIRSWFWTIPKLKHFFFLRRCSLTTVFAIFCS